jgi:hypothetical protein
MLGICGAVVPNADLLVMHEKIMNELREAFRSKT